MKDLAMITLALLLAMLPPACSCIEEQIEARMPSVMVTNILRGETSGEESTVTVSVQIENPNPIGATLDRIEYDIYFGHEGNWMLLGRGERGTLNIKANAATDFEIATVIENKQLVRALLEFMFSGEPAQMKVDGSAWLKVGPASFKIPFEEVVMDSEAHSESK